MLWKSIPSLESPGSLGEQVNFPDQKYKEEKKKKKKEQQETQCLQLASRDYSTKGNLIGNLQSQPLRNRGVRVLEIYINRWPINPDEAYARNGVT